VPNGFRRTAENFDKSNITTEKAVESFQTELRNEGVGRRLDRQINLAPSAWTSRGFGRVDHRTANNASRRLRGRATCGTVGGRAGPHLDIFAMAEWTALMQETRTYSLRLKERFAWYDWSGSQMFHDFPAGYVATDQREIALLESLNAPTERIFEGVYLR
jgi:hypothetical protein